MSSSPSKLEPGIRNAARAVILRDDRVLMLCKSNGEKATRYALPGGAQEPGETLAAALRRECREEIGCEIRLGPLLLVADFFKPRDTQPPRYRQLVECLYRCDVPGDYQPHNGYRPDKHQVGVAWIDRQQLKALTLTPGFLGDFLAGNLDAPPHYTDDYAGYSDSNEYR